MQQLERMGDCRIYSLSLVIVPYLSLRKESVDLEMRQPETSQPAVTPPPRRLELRSRSSRSVLNNARRVELIAVRGNYANHARLENVSQVVICFALIGDNVVDLGPYASMHHHCLESSSSRMAFSSAVLLSSGQSNFLDE